MNYVITEFNDEVQNIIYQLQSCGKTIPLLMVNLLADNEFVS